MNIYTSLSVTKICLYVHNLILDVRHTYLSHHTDYFFCSNWHTKMGHQKDPNISSSTLSNPEIFSLFPLSPPFSLLFFGSSFIWVDQLTMALSLLRTLAKSTALRSNAKSFCIVSTEVVTSHTDKWMQVTILLFSSYNFF